MCQLTEGHSGLICWRIKTLDINLVEDVETTIFLSSFIEIHAAVAEKRIENEPANQRPGWSYLSMDQTLG